MCTVHDVTIKYIINVYSIICHVMSFTIVGRNLGFLDWKVEEVSYGMLTDSEFQLDTTKCVIDSAHIKLRCPMTAGAGRQMTWRLVVDGQASVYPTSAYGIPMISAFTIDSTSILSSRIDSLNSHGGQKIVIHGQNFGPRTDFISRVTFGPFGSNYLAKNCTIKVASFQIVCLTPPGIGQNHKWIVSIRGQTNQFSLNEPTTSYAIPEIVEITPGVGRTNGGTEITIRGRHFGAVDLDSGPGVAVYFGSFGGAMLGCKQYEVRRGRNNPAKPNPTTMDNNETITFLLPEFYTAGHMVSVAVGANSCPEEVGEFVLFLLLHSALLC